MFSQSLNKFYTGQTADLENRLLLHQEQTFKSSFTATTHDWELYLSVECPSRQSAIKLENKIKGMKSSKYIRNLKRYPELIEKLKTTIFN